MGHILPCEGWGEFTRRDKEVFHAPRLRLPPLFLAQGRGCPQGPNLQEKLEGVGFGFFIFLLSFGFPSASRTGLEPPSHFDVSCRQLSDGNIAH